MMVASPNDPDEFGSDWNPEGEDLAFLRDEGLELLALFKSIKEDDKRRLILDLVRVIAGEQPRR